MTDEQQKERFSAAYVRAVAAVAKVNVSVPEVDDDSVDLCFAGRIVLGRPQRPRLEAQLKCTAVPDDDGTAFRLPLKLKNYNDLRGDDTVPRVLVLVVVPEDRAEWLSLSPEQLTLRNAAYWVSLAGCPETPNTTSVTVSVPKSQLFDVAALRWLLKLEGSP